MLTAKQAPYTGPYSLATGPHRSRGPTAKALKIAMKRMGEAPFAGRPNAQFDEHYNQALEDALDRATTATWSGYGERRWEAVRALRTARGEYALNKEARDLILTDFARMTAVVVPDLGPLYAGGRSVLDHSPTHPTTGIPRYIAFDDAWRAGTVIIAPEDVEITRDSSSYPGDACYALGTSTLEYWLGHLVKAPPKGMTLARGERVGVVLDHSIGGGPHVHCGVNVEGLLGSGTQLEWGANGDGPDYTHGAPTIREQLERALA